jgi:hypothetical protein
MITANDMESVKVIVEHEKNIGRSLQSNLGKSHHTLTAEGPLSNAVVHYIARLRQKIYIYFGLLCTIHRQPYF